MDTTCGMCADVCPVSTGGNRFTHPATCGPIKKGCLIGKHWEGRVLFKHSMAMRRLATAIALFALIMTMGARGAAAELWSGQGATTGGSGLVRSEPGYGSSVVAELGGGAWVTVLSGPYYDSEGLAWYEVDAGGYLPEAELYGDESAVADEAPAEEVYVEEPVYEEAPAEEYTPDWASAYDYDASNVYADGWVAGTRGDGAVCRDGASFDANVVGRLNDGDWVGIIGDPVGEWQPVSCGGSPAFVHASFVAFEPPVVDEPSDNGGGGDRGNGRNDRGNGRGNVESGGGQYIVDFAMQYVGYPYVYAGEGPNAFDCSGFTMFVFQNTMGIDITHDMFTQIGMGHSVSMDELQPGDLVFFGDTFRAGLSHVGIYIGGGQFVHAENEETGVVVTDLNSDYYGSRYYGATRLW